VLQLNFQKADRTPLRLLFLGAHCDDIEIGCGGTILKLLQNQPDAIVNWIVFSSNDVRRPEALTAAQSFLRAAARPNIIVKDFRDGFFPYIGGEIKTFFEETVKGLQPDIVFTHYRHDRHQDHRVISELAWNTFRNHCVLEYEIPKYDGDLGQPNVFVHLDEPTCRLKVDQTLASYVSQREKRWFTEDTLFGLLRLRGMESASPTKFAEAFYGHKIVI